MIRLDILFDAVIFSNLLVLMSIGLTLTYMTLKIPNFAHGDFVTFGVYASYTVYRVASVFPYASLPIAFLTPGCLALALYLAVFRPLSRRGSSIVGLMIASIAVEIILRSAMHIYADVMTQVSPPNVFYRGFIIPELFHVSILGARLPGLLIISSLLVLGLITTFHALLTKTKFGVAMRAAIENPSLASTLGVNVGLVYAISWFLAGGLAGVAGAILPIRIPCDPEVGWGFLLRIFAATILGGFSSIYGAAVGGYIVGFAEVVGIYLLAQPPLNLSAAYKPAISFAIIVATLLVAPKGLTAIDWRALAIRLRLLRREV